MNVESLERKGDELIIRGRLRNDADGGEARRTVGARGIENAGLGNLAFLATLPFRGRRK